MGYIKKCIQSYSENLKEIQHTEYHGVCQRIILRWILDILCELDDVDQIAQAQIKAQ